VAEQDGHPLSRDSDWPGRKTLASFLGLFPRTIQDTLADLATIDSGDVVEEAMRAGKPHPFFYYLYITGHYWSYVYMRVLSGFRCFMPAHSSYCKN